MGRFDEHFLLEQRNTVPNINYVETDIKREEVLDLRMRYREIQSTKQYLQLFVDPRIGIHKFLLNSDPTDSLGITRLKNSLHTSFRLIREQDRQQNGLKNHRKVSERKPRIL
ncbi:hypothetical protein NQ317_013296 [Molorchus minor]|uniref:Uncharacterized protein n=1 Tax=Molorchus minor TaxID=1323400 RepID=A0ABQ9JIZ7_9CUCU|nr:hypothetical protein NQ317_013296 [Molorchus minor]